MPTWSWFGSPRSPRWGQVRAAHLAAHPTCAACGGRRQLEVHHKVPYHLAPERELDPANLITLCSAQRCHFLFGHCLDWKAYNPEVEADCAHFLSRVQSRLYVLRPEDAPAPPAPPPYTPAMGGFGGPMPLLDPPAAPLKTRVRKLICWAWRRLTRRPESG